MVTSTQERGFIDRLVGAALLDGAVYEEVEHDAGATGQAALVVVLGAVAAGVGLVLEGPIALVVGIVMALVGWAAYAYVAYWVGTRWFATAQTSADWGELLRTLGFASAPRLLLVLGIIPALGLLLSLLVLVWTLVTTVVAIRHALDFDTARAIGTAVVSWLALIIVSWLVSALVFSLG